MARENTADLSISSTLPDSLDEWLDGKSEELELSRGELVAQVLAAYRAVDEAEGDGPDEALRTEVERLDAELSELEVDYREALDDVRNRVVEVKLDADEKATADHDHPELAERTERAAARAETGVQKLSELRTEVERGFENYEDVLEYLTDTTDDVEEKLETLARTVVELRTQVRAVAGRHAARVAVEELAGAANRHGVRSAACEECGGSVDVALLVTPECPHCGATFGGVELRDGLRGLLGSGVLVVGDPPALDGEVLADDDFDALDDEILDADGEGG